MKFNCNVLHCDSSAAINALNKHNCFLVKSSGFEVCHDSAGFVKLFTSMPVCAFRDTTPIVLHPFCRAQKCPKLGFPKPHSTCRLHHRQQCQRTIWFCCTAPDKLAAVTISTTPNQTVALTNKKHLEKQCWHTMQVQVLFLHVLLVSNTLFRAAIQRPCDGHNDTDAHRCAQMWAI
jgi:hypothetical protein